MDEFTHKQCPHCKETILKDAGKCRHCGGSTPNAAVVGCIGCWAIAVFLWFVLMLGGCLLITA